MPARDGHRDDWDRLDPAAVPAAARRRARTPAWRIVLAPGCGTMLASCVGCWAFGWVLIQVQGPQPDPDEVALARPIVGPAPAPTAPPPAPEPPTVLAAEPVAARYNVFHSPDGVVSYRLGMRWKNTGNRPIRQLVARIQAFRHDGLPDRNASHSGYAVYVRSPADPGLLPGETCTASGPMLLLADAVDIDIKMTRVSLAAVEEAGNKLSQPYAQRPPNSVDVRATFSGVKQGGDGYYTYSFDVVNQSEKPVRGELRLWLLDNWAGEPPTAVERVPDSGQLAPRAGIRVEVRSQFGPCSAPKDYGMAAFKFTFRADDKTLAFCEGSVAGL